MAVSGVNDADNLQNMFRASATKASNSDLSMDDFLNLIVAQLQNQDMMNPMNDTEFFSQMAQFSTIQAIQSMGDITNTNYASTLLGKEVTAAKMVNNQLQTEKGVITGVGLYEGEPIVYIGNNKYKLSEIMVVGSMSEDEENATLTPDKTEESNEIDTEDTDKTETTDE